MTDHRPSAANPRRARYRASALALLLGLTVPSLASCKLLEGPAPAGPPPTGTVSHTRVEPAADGGQRVVATIEDAEGHTWQVRLPLDTACVRYATYPACAG